MNSDGRTQRTVTIRDVAERAGVSAGTVSNVLNRPFYVNSDTRERVLDAVVPDAEAFAAGERRPARAAQDAMHRA